jgi:hypothetical protein
MQCPSLAFCEHCPCLVCFVLCRCEVGFGPEIGWLMTIQKTGHKSCRENDHLNTGQSGIWAVTVQALL